MWENKVLTLWQGDRINEEEAAVLRTASAELTFPLDRAGRGFVDALLEAFLARDDALGLAAPQIGISKRIIVFRNKGFDDKGVWTKDEEDSDLLINPRITQGRGELIYMAEGCLSCPEIQVEVGRFPEIKVRALDREGRKINKRYKGFLARIVQHEIDHLDGRLILDYEGKVIYPQKRRNFFDKIFQER